MTNLTTWHLGPIDFIWNSMPVKSLRIQIKNKNILFFQTVFTCYEYGITVCNGRSEELGTEATSKFKKQIKSLS